ncbi:hypothetical protein EBR57_04385 [bacterium]|nr:hypothetical protein [bacterium]
MKSSHPIPIIACALFLFAAACQNQAPTAIETQEPSALIGQWIVSADDETATASVEFKDDYRFVITVDGNEGIEAEGAYSVTGNEVILQNEGVTASGDCTLSATYAFTVDGDTVTFERIQDDLCGERVRLFNKTWSRK